ncbi:MAG: LptF/LptG family permease [Fusobacterium sp. JB021]|nr:LptF/LptG family permease [Fusobacterium sp. JB021]MDP0507665.1 LptF/LptG family permease [Fusobacterium sp. JB019]
MKKLDIYISKNFIKSFLISLIAFMNIFLLSQLFKVFRYVADGRMSSYQGVLYLFNMLPEVIVNMTPLAVLLGSLMFINKMASNLEIISLKTSGISFRRIIVCPIIISFIISLVVYYINGNIYPRSERRMRELKGDKIIKTIPIEKRNAFLRDRNNNVYYIGYINSNKETAKDFQIIKMNETFSEIEKVIIAKNANFDKNEKIWKLSDVVINDILNKKSEKIKNYSNKEFNEQPENFFTLSTNPKFLTNKELRKEIINMKITGGDTRSGLVELGKRYSFPFASLVIILIGLSLGSRYVRAASAKTIGISIFFGYGYYIIQGLFEALSKNGLINAFLGGWIPNILFLLLGIYLIYKSEY